MMQSLLLIPVLQLKRNIGMMLGFFGVWGMTAQPSVHANELRVRETDHKIEVLAGAQVILAYNKVSPKAPNGIDSVFERSGFLHPVFTPKGRCVTESFPADHPHQQGIFSAWVKTAHDGKQVDFWNLAKRSGRVVHADVIETFSDADRTGFVVDLVHQKQGKPSVAILKERWRISVTPTDGAFRCFDLETKQAALNESPLIVRKYHYGGVAIRGPSVWLTERPGDGRTTDGGEQQPPNSGFRNSLGSGRIKGNHEHPDWVTMWGEVGGQDVAITVMCSTRSFRSPQATRLHPKKPYFCFCPCVDGQFVIEKDRPYTAHYRFLVTDNIPEREWLEKRWEEFVTSK
jgi:hypothetical protein